MLYDSDRVFRIFLGGIQSRFCFRSAPAVKQVFPDTIGSIGMKNRIITVQGAPRLASRLGASRTTFR
jgi:hypothetical protein